MSRDEKTEINDRHKRQRGKKNRRQKEEREQEERARCHVCIIQYFVQLVCIEEDGCREKMQVDGGLKAKLGARISSFWKRGRNVAYNPLCIFVVCKDVRASSGKADGGYFEDL